MGSSEIYQDLGDIRERMRRNKQMLSRETVIKRLKDDSENIGRLKEYDFETDPMGLVDYFMESPDIANSRVARSEYLVSPENIRELESTITTAREIIFAVGKPMTAHPDYEELYENQPVTIGHALNEFWLNTENTNGHAERYPFEDRDNKGKLLDVCATDSIGSVNFSFGFDNKYDIYIQFTHQQTGKLEASYSSSGTVQEMDDREFRLIHHYTNVLLREANTQSEDSPHRLQE